jgi:N-acetylglucosaminyldiphosphoundecaprenol N-acetyl-beta-D-mannosaminyltransferase
MKVNILGIPIHNVDLNEAVRTIIKRVDDYSLNPIPRYVATANVDFLVNTLSWIPGKIKHQELYQALIMADLVTADGMPIVWLSALLGKRLKERVTGADLVPRLAAAASVKAFSLFLLGGREGVGEKAAKKLLTQNPGLKIAGCLSPKISLKETDSKIIDQINKSKADILLLALGNPKQEIWFQKNKHLIKVPVSIGVGGTYEFIAGTVSRSPKWMQKSGLEWVYRLYQEPKRLWKRYCLDITKFGFLAGLFILSEISNKIFDRLGSEKIVYDKEHFNTCVRGEK